MLVAVIGAGAIGSAVAAALVQAGRNVVLVARGQRLAQLQTGPLRLESAAGVQALQVPTCAMNALVRDSVDIAICCVKTNGLEPALTGLRDALKPGAVVLTLQNGVEAPGVAARLLPDAAIVAGRMHGFFEMSDDRVRHVGVPPSILLGSLQCLAVAEQAVVRAMAGSGIATEVSPNITLALWEKFLLATSLGTVAAALGIPAGQVLANAEGAPLLRQAMVEIVDLAIGLGVGLSHRNISETLAFVAGFPPDATTSLQRDLANGRPSELDALAGAVLRLSRTDGPGAPTLHELHGRIVRHYHLAPAATH